MKPTRPLFRLEMSKLLHAPLVRISTLACLAIVVLTTAGGYAAAIHAPSTNTGRKAAAMVTAPGWEGYTGLGALSAGVTMLLVAGIVMSWTAGREFSDNTIVGLFAIPPGPGSSAAAKILTMLAWLICLAAAEAALLTGAGLVLGLGGAGAPTTFAALLLSTSLLGASALPAMWVSSRWRGYLPGIGATLGIVIITNIAAGFGLGRWLPWAIPTLWATPGTGIPTTLLVAPAAIAALGAAATISTWRRLQLGRA